MPQWLTPTAGCVNREKASISRGTDTDDFYLACVKAKVSNSYFGDQIHSSLSGSMHDHVLNFKADSDILGCGEFPPTQSLSTQPGMV